MPDNSLVLKAENLSLAFGQRQILDDISLQLPVAGITTLIGPNGCGKSSLIRILLGLQRSDGGSVWRRPGVRIGYMPQRLQLDERLPLTVRGFLELALGMNSSDLQYWMERLNIAHLASSDIHHLSGGEWQRVLLARALLCRPDLLILDEPVQGIDVHGQLELYRLIPQLRDELGCAVLMVSHDLHLVMAATDEVICLNGHICCSGHPDRVASDPKYLQLFNPAGIVPQVNESPTTPIAHYTHHHNHHHDEISGCVDQALPKDTTLVGDTAQPTENKTMDISNDSTMTQRRKTPDA